MDVEQLKNSFKTIYGADPLVVSSPGRINIIGEHTDYNEGFVLPAAIDKAIYVAICKREDEEIHLYSKSYDQRDISSLSNLQKSEKSWANYIIGVTDQIQKRRYQIGGFNLYLDGNVPLGAGLSSSAAVECATAYAIDQLFALSIPKMDIALISQKAEHVFAGVNCGIMDQFASVFGKKDQAMMLDCRSMEYEYIPLKMDGFKLVLLNTHVKHSLSDSAYNKRRAQCEQGVNWVRSVHPGVHSLRDVDVQMLDEYVKPVDKEVYTKCRFVIEENLRLLKAVEKLKGGDLKALGTLMLETHKGLSEDFEVSCAELDFLVNEIKDLDFVLGARMMGGGFGGCTLNIVKNQHIDTLIDQITESYFNQFGINLGTYVVETGMGTKIIN